MECGSKDTPPALVSVPALSLPLRAAVYGGAQWQDIDQF